MELGINLSFAVKRWPEPEAWAAFVAEQLDLQNVQFSFDLLDPWWPADVRDRQARRVRAAAEANGLAVHSAQIGLAAYAYNGLLHPEAELRTLAERWWEQAIEVAAAMGAARVGGPVGALTMAGLDDGEGRERRHADLIEILLRLAERAKAAGLSGLLIEPTPLSREMPSTLPEARRLATALVDAAVPFVYVIDVGHVLLRPFHGSDAALGPWLDLLGDGDGVLHLQNTDLESDSHWGWPDPRGSYDVAGFAREVRAADRGHLPVFLEMFYPFELDDEIVRANIVSSVDHCRRALYGVRPSEPNPIR